MKSIEYCLDAILIELEKNWMKEERKNLSVHRLMTDFGLPVRHEFFEGLIDKLISDGFAKLKDGMRSDVSRIDVYQKDTLITVNGFYLIKEKGGYQSEKRKEFWNRSWDRVIKFLAIPSFIISIFAVALNKPAPIEPNPLPFKELQVLKERMIVLDSLYNLSLHKDTVMLNNP